MNLRGIGSASQRTLYSTVFVTAMLLGSSASATTPTSVSTESASPKAIPWSEVGATAGAQYSGEGLKVVQTEQGARLDCVFQRLEGEATREGLWLTSSVTNQANDRFRVTAAAIGGRALPQRGEITVDGRVVRFTRPGLIEEYSVSMDGVRQDFVVLERPPVPINHQPSTINSTSLFMELAVTGAHVEQTAYGAQLVLESGRKIAYSRLRVTDVNGKELPAHIEVTSTALRATHLITAMTVVVDDANAVYPVRIDPTFSDANWVSMGGVAGADRDVFASAVDSFGNLYIGGSFTAVGDVIAHKVAKWNGSNWSALGSGLNNGVSALAVLGGDLYAGGDFIYATNADSTTVLVNRIAKWNGSSWSSLGSGVGGSIFGSVYALAASGSDLFAGGSFTQAGGSPANYIAKWNGSTWSPLGSGMDGSVLALAVSGANLYAGGVFVSAGGNDAYYIAKWDGNFWSAVGPGIDSPGPVYALAAAGSDVFVGGENGSVAKWDGTNWTVLGWVGGWVYALAAAGSNVYVGGEFTMAGGIPTTGVAQWNGSSWSALGSGIGRFGFVSTLAVWSSNVYAGGYFSTAGNIAANYIASWSGSDWRSLASGRNVNGEVLVLTVQDGEVYVGGNFTTAGNTVANRIAKWNGNAWTALGLGLNNTVSAIAVSGTNVYAGGNFTASGSNLLNRIARWDGNSWRPLGPGVDDWVRAMALLDGNLYAGGEFATAGGVTAKSIARWDGAAWNALGSGLSGGVRTLAVSGSDLYVGGGFTMAGGNPADSVAKWNGSSWSALGLGIKGGVQALAIAGSELYAGGWFTIADGNAANYIAKWNGSSWVAMGSGLDFVVRALTVAGSRVFAGGSAGGNATDCIAQWDGSAWSELGTGILGLNGFQPSHVYALAASGNDVYAGGEFTTAGGKRSAYFAKWAPLAFRANSVTISNGTFHALLTGPDTNSVVVDGTTYLTNWSPVVTNTLPSGGAWQLSLPTGTNSHQFYRARLGP